MSQDKEGAPPNYDDIYNKRDFDTGTNNGDVYVDLESGQQQVIQGGSQHQPTVIVINNGGNQNRTPTVKRVGKDIYVSFMDGRSDNNLFVIKVLTTVCCQLLFTTLIGVWAYNSNSFRTFLLYAFWPSIIFMFVTIIALSCCGLYNKFPINIILFVAFTTCVSFMIGLVVTFYTEQTLVMAVGLTLIIFLTITLYLVITKKDFDFLGPGLLAVTFLLIFLPIIFYFFPVGSTVRTIWYVVGIIVFIGWLLFDISRLVNGKYQDIFGQDYAWLMAAIDIYMDLINLFLYILQLLGGNGGGD